MNYMPAQLESGLLGRIRAALTQTVLLVDTLSEHQFVLDVASVFGFRQRYQSSVTQKITNIIISYALHYNTSSWRRYLS